MAREKITLQRRWMETAKDLPDDERMAVYGAIVQYAFDGSVKEFASQLATAAFGIIRQDIDNEQARQAEISAKRKQAGAKGGRHKKIANEPKGKEPEVKQQENPPEKPIQAPPQQQDLFGNEIPIVEKVKPQKKKYAPLVMLFEEEYEKLKTAYGEDGVKWMVTKLDNYKAARGTTYKSDYRAILNWVSREYIKQLDYGRTTEIGQNNATATAKEQRDAEFVAHITQKLGSD